VDVVVTSEEDALPCADSPGRVIGPALAEGKVVLYEREPNAEFDNVGGS